MTTTTDNEVQRENRLRRMARRQGFAIVKSRARDWQRIDYGRYMIVDENNCVVAGTGGTERPNMDLDSVEAWLTSD